MWGPTELAKDYLVVELGQDEGQRSDAGISGARVDSVEAEAKEAKEEEEEEEEEQENGRVVAAFYDALAASDVDTVRALLGPDDLEWRFHGPPSEQHLMHMLTGQCSSSAFCFRPISIRAFGDSLVFAEGSHSSSSSPSSSINSSSNSISSSPKSTSSVSYRCWVHVWTVKSGKITQLREYFNTSLTVVKPPSSDSCSSSSQSSSSSSPSNTLSRSPQNYPLNSGPRATVSPRGNPDYIWQSRLGREAGKSIPSLILAI
jgi:limonene-1,2-epoxide hydrolase